MFAKRSDWKTKKMPKENISINLNKIIKKTEMNEIKKGLIPQEMEDKWFIFNEGNFIYFHRSWTGHCIYIAEYKQTKEDEFVIINLTVNRNPKQYSSDDIEYDVNIFGFLLERLLLDNNVSFPVTDNSNEQNNILKHTTVGYAKSRKDIEKDE